MLPRTVEGVLFDTTGVKGVLFVPIPFNPGVDTPNSIDDCHVEYWVHQQPSRSRSKNIDLYRKTIKINTNNNNILYNIYFADQTGDFPKNKSIQTMAPNSPYTTWVGAVLVIKSDEEGHPIACSGWDTLYIPEAIERLVSICIEFLITKKVQIYGKCEDGFTIHKTIYRNKKNEGYNYQLKV